VCAVTLSSPSFSIYLPRYETEKHEAFDQVEVVLAALVSVEFLDVEALAVSTQVAEC